jgi:hypothetical protein
MSSALSIEIFKPVNTGMDTWYDWDTSDQPVWSLYREWLDPEIMGERFTESGGFGDDE